mmetsp:Transcript_26587/g.82203  ORF Transcript_26587/g.82203 Transcript_26587/m.82203 type:complete len:231 (-) Transcript_26587:17-709(-)
MGPDDADRLLSWFLPLGRPKARSGAAGGAWRCSGRRSRDSAGSPAERGESRSLVRSASTSHVLASGDATTTTGGTAAPASRGPPPCGPAKKKESSHSFVADASGRWLREPLCCARLLSAECAVVLTEPHPRKRGNWASCIDPRLDAVALFRAGGKEVRPVVECGRPNAAAAAEVGTRGGRTAFPVVFEVDGRRAEFIGGCSECGVDSVRVRKARGKWRLAVGSSSTTGSQ